MPDPPGDTIGEFDSAYAPQMNVDAMFQEFSEFHPEYPDTHFNAFNEGYDDSVDMDGSMGIVEDLFKGVGVDVSFADPYPLEYNRDSVNRADYTTFWQIGHFDIGRGLDFPYYLLSVNRHAYDSSLQLPWDQILGIFALRPCSCGTARDFDSIIPEFAMVCYVPLHRYQEEIWANGVVHNYDLQKKYCHRVWGISLAHELGHLYACIKDNILRHHPAARCIYKEYTLDDWDLDLLLETPVFCDSCKNYIGMVNQ